MLNYIEYLNMPTKVAIAIVACFLVMQLIGELIEFNGKTAPEIIKIRKYFSRKNKEHDMLDALPDMFDNVSTLLKDVEEHYNSDNIEIRNQWMCDVNTRLDAHEDMVKEISEKIDKNNEEIFDLLMNSKRDIIINFAEKVSNDEFPATREQFTRIFKIYEDYEHIISEHDLTNGEVDVAYRIINEAYQIRLKNHSFLEDIRWHNVD